MKFTTLLKRVARNRRFKRPSVLICLDPGQTTGWAIFKDAELVEFGQMDTSVIGSAAREIYAFLAQQIDKYGRGVVLYENYRVYQHKLRQHSNAELHTAKFIGMIEASCQLLDLETHNQMAATVKPFCTDAKLKEWGYYQTGVKHANDAIRHGCYLLLFGYPKNRKSSV